MFPKFAWYHVLGFFWVLPVSILGWVFIGILAALRQIENIEVQNDLSFVWDLKNSGFFYKYMEGKWFGFAVGNSEIVADAPDTERGIRKLKHENRHVKQQYALGVFFFPVYVVESLRLFFFHKDKHAYLDNWFERDARKHAGQIVDILPEQWPEGPKDRWPWWG